jgi:hypothetical protein
MAPLTEAKALPFLLIGSEGLAGAGVVSLPLDTASGFQITLAALLPADGITGFAAGLAGFVTGSLPVELGLGLGQPTSCACLH